MAIEILQDKRPDYVSKLRAIADLIEQTDKQPIGFSMQLFWNDHEITVAGKEEAGLNPLIVAGLFLRLANEAAMNGIEKEKLPTS